MRTAVPSVELGYLVEEAQDEGAHLLVGVLLQDLRPLRVPGGRQHLLQSPQLPLKLLQLLLQVDVRLTCRLFTCRRVPVVRGGGAPQLYCSRPPGAPSL